MFRKVLLVEDDSDQAELFQLALSAVKPDVELVTARNGVEALSVLRMNIDPDVIFLDINMPLMNGWEFLAALKADSALKYVPVIMQSTADTRDAIEKSFTLGANAYLTKSISFGELKDTLRFILSQDDMKKFRSAMLGYKDLHFPFGEEK